MHGHPRGLQQSPVHFVGLKACELMVPLLHLRLQHRQVGCQVGQQDLPHRLVPQGNETHHSTCRQSKLLLKAACDVAGPFVEASVVAPVSSLAMELAMPKMFKPEPLQLCLPRKTGGLSRLGVSQDLC